MNSAPRLLLRLFGSPCIVEPSGVLLTGRATQRHRLALLALLALAPNARLGREKLMAYLWPESDDEHARSLLNQAVYVLRRAVGDAAIASGGDELRLNALAVDVDVGAFEAARAAGDHARMVDLYSGPLLDGFFLDDAPEFVEWLERERSRLAGEYARALEAIADKAEGELDLKRAAEWWKARSMLDPYDSRVALRLMETLAASGNRAGALQEGANHQRLLQAEFSLDPPPEVLEFADRLRRGPAPVLSQAAGAREAIPQPPSVAPPETAPDPGATTSTERHERPTSPETPGMRGYAFAVLTAGLVIIGALSVFPSRTSPAEPPAAAPSIAILPLAAESGDRPLANGIIEELIAMLVKAGGLRVVAGTSVVAVADRQGDVRQVADSLRVDNILEGTLQRSGSRLRVRLRLVDGRDGATRWSETYDRELREVFLVQDEIARSVAGELGLRLGTTADASIRRLPTQNVAAYEFYLRGNDPALPRSEIGSRQRLEYFRKAIALDSTYAAAYAGLAAGYLRLTPDARSGHSFDELQALAEEAVLKALSFDDSIPLTHLAYGSIRLRNLEYAGAEEQFNRALALDPGMGRAEEGLVQVYLQTGQRARALIQAEKALETDPLSPSANAEVARALLANGRCDEALVRLDMIAAVQPPLLRVPLIAAQCHAMQGKLQEAIAAIRPQSEREPNARALLGYLLARAGQREEAVALRASMREHWASSDDGAVHVAVISAGLGELDETFLWLDRAIDDRSIRPIWGYGIVLEPVFEELHSDSRFQRVETALALQ